MERQQLIDVYGHLFDIGIMDEWASIYTNKKLFWQAQYARFYAKEIYDIAVALDNDNVESNVWTIADTSEMLAKVLESSLVTVQ